MLEFTIHTAKYQDLINTPNIFRKTLGVLYEIFQNSVLYVRKYRVYFSVVLISQQFIDERK